MPHRNGGLSRSHSGAAGDEVCAALQTLGRDLQTHEAELHTAAGADDVLAAGSVVLHPLATSGTCPDGGTLVHSLDLWQGGVLAVPENLQIEVVAAVVVAAVRARGSAFPLIQTLAAEVEGGLLLHFADGALHAEVGQVLTLHVSFTAGTLEC